MKEKNLDELLEKVSPDHRLSLLQASIALKEALFLDQKSSAKKYFRDGLIVGVISSTICFFVAKFVFHIF